MGAVDPFASVQPWRLPSFDPPPPPPPPPPPSLSQGEIDSVLEEARVRGDALGFEAGTVRGFAEGRERGLVEGRDEGHRLAFDAARQRLDELAASMQATLDEIAGFPAAIAEPVVDLALLVAQRLSGSQQFERAAFVQAVHDALMHLPMPGEKLLLRIGPSDERTWKEALDSFDLPFGHAIAVDADLPPGRAFVEVGGTRLDIGPAARQALVRAALGLPLAP